MIFFSITLIFTEIPDIFLSDIRKIHRHVQLLQKSGHPHTGSDLALYPH